MDMVYCIVKEDFADGTTRVEIHVVGRGWEAEPATRRVLKSRELSKWKLPKLGE